MLLKGAIYLNICLVLYAYENGNERIYFTARGLVYKMIKTFPLTEEQREEQEKGKKVNGNY